MQVIDVPNYGKVEFPDGMTDAEIVSAIKKNQLGYKKTEPVKMGKERFADDLREVLQDTDWGTRNIAGAGTALSNLWEGVKQLVGKDNKETVANNKIIAEEAPIGAIAGDVALAAVPFSAVGKGLKAASAVGAGYGALQPVQGETAAEIAKNKGINSATGGAAALAGQAIANKVGSAIESVLERKAAQKAKNAVLDATIQEARDSGYVVPPSMMPDSGVMSRILEGVSGKYKTNQLAGIKNQQTTNNLVRADLGLAEDAPLSIDAIKSVREANYAPYREISNLPKLKDTPPVPEDTLRAVYGKPGEKGFDPAKALEELKTARADTTAWFNAYNRSAHPEDLAKAKAFQASADALETSLEDYAKGLGKDKLVAELQQARKMIAKTYTAERALDKGTGNIDAKVLGRLFDKGKPLSGGMGTVGKFASSFGDVAKVPASGHANPFTIIDAGYALPAGAVNPLAALLPLARVGARYGLLSGPAQNALSRPTYAISPASRMAGGLLQYSPVGFTALGANALN